MKKRKKIRKPKVQSFKVTLHANGKGYSAKGKTILDALSALKTEPVKTKAFMTVERGSQRYERILGLIQVRQLFGGGSPTIQGIVRFKMAKFLESAFV